MNSEQATIINSNALNQCYLLQIDSETDITDVRFRENPEIETTYETEEGVVITSGGLKWFTLFRTNNGGYKKTLDFNLLFELKTELGDRFIQYKELPKDEVEEVI